MQQENNAEDAESVMEQARALMERREIAATLCALDYAERLGADPNTCAGDRWQCWMLLGEWERAWRQSDAIRERAAEDPHRLWDGSSWAGKRVMLRCLHGFGDAIQFIRYAPLLRREAAHLTIEAAPRLVELMRCFDGMDDVITWGDAAPAHPPAWDVQMEIMELPYLFRAMPETVPRHLPYLRLPRATVTNMAAAMGPHERKRVGLVWAGGEWNRDRCIPLSLLRLLERTDVSFYSLQGGADNAEWSHFRREYGLHDAADYGDGLMPLAATIANLDLVITIDTMAAHLAGAMGRPVWLLLQHCADWRWMLDRADSPWYSTMRIFRQKHAGEWTGVMSDLSTRLDAWTARQADTIEPHAAMGQV